MYRLSYTYSDMSLYVCPPALLLHFVVVVVSLYGIVLAMFHPIDIVTAYVISFFLFIMKGILTICIEGFMLHIMLALKGPALWISLQSKGIGYCLVYGILNYQDIMESFL